MYAVELEILSHHKVYDATVVDFDGEHFGARAKFSEIVQGIPVLDEWTLASRFHKPTLPRVEFGQIFNVKFVDSTATKVDTLRLLPRLR